MRSRSLCFGAVAWDDLKGRQTDAVAPQDEVEKRV